MIIKLREIVNIMRLTILETRVPRARSSLNVVTANRSAKNTAKEIGTTVKNPNAQNESLKSINQLRKPAIHQAKFINMRKAKLIAHITFQIIFSFIVIILRYK
jgi:hypothetical protein